jgi:cbb3-type cytochrome oxidase maturation protein
MEIIILLVAISLTIALVFLGVFFWNIRNGQYEDTYTPSVRMLFDDKPKLDKPTTIQSTKTKLDHDKLSQPRNTAEKV